MKPFEVEGVIGDRRSRMSGFHVASAAVLSTVIFTPAAAHSYATQIIDVRSFAFTPTPIRISAGKPVTLRFVNSSGSSHDFTSKQFFVYSKIVGGSAPEGEIELKPHETKTITLIPRAGSYSAHCSHFMHAALGMHVQIFVS